MAMWAIMDLSVKIKSGSDTFWTVKIWEWHRFTAVIWKNDTKSFIFPKLKMISVQNFDNNTTVLCTFCWTWCFFVVSDINYIDTKIDQIILKQVPCLRNFMKKWWPFWTKWPPFLVSTKKHHVQQNVHNTVVWSSKFHKGGCAISVQHYLRMAPFHSSYMEKWHEKLHIS
jgi:hypothetical protein